MVLPGAPAGCVSGESTVKRVLIDGELKALISTRWRSSVERTLRHQVSEHDLLQVHEEFFLPLRNALDPVRDAIESGPYEAITPGVRPPRRAELDAIDTLRRLLDRGAKERELQTALVESGLLLASSGQVVQEVAIEATNTERAMRLDLLLESDGDSPAEIIELKRGSHLLLAHRGKPAERLSQGLVRALNQLRAYGRRVDSDIEAAASIRE